MTTDNDRTFKKIDWLLRDAQSDVESTRESLIFKMRSLARTLTEEAERMEADATRMPNPLGVLQGNAGEADRLCAVLDEQSKRVRCLARMAALVTDSAEGE